jgi:hypothetical protein
MHKRGNIGQLSGDIPRRKKIKMLESKTPFNIFEWQRLSQKAISAFRNEHYRKINKKIRQEVQRQTLE